MVRLPRVDKDRKQYGGSSILASVGRLQSKSFSATLTTLEAESFVNRSPGLTAL